MMANWMMGGQQQKQQDNWDEGKSAMGQQGENGVTVVTQDNRGTMTTAT